MKRKNLLRWEIDKGLKKKEIAEKLGITKEQYSRIVNCKSDPSIETMYKFQEVFKVDDVLELLKKED